MKDKILFVGGDWNLEGGKSSKMVSKFAEYLPCTTVFNGGYYNQLKQILASSIYYNIVIWWANVPNELPKIRKVKDVNAKTMLVSSKRNINNQYSFQDLLQHSFGLKSNLTIEFSKVNNLYKMKLFENIRFPVGKLSEDYFIMYKLFDNSNKIVYSSYPVYYYMQRDGSISKSKKINYDYIEASYNQMIENE